MVFLKIGNDVYYLRTLKKQYLQLMVLGKDIRWLNVVKNKQLKVQKNRISFSSGLSRLVSPM